MEPRFSRIIISLLVLASFVSGAVASDTDADIAAKLDSYIEAKARIDGFSGSVLIARNGQPVLSKGYGMANYELDVPNKPTTVFRLGSITKSFTAAAIMLLQERGKLNVDDSICKHLPDCPAAWQPVTIRHLLLHNSGIPSYTSLPGYEETFALPVTHASLIGRLRDKPLEFAPGTKATYNNSGFYLAGVIIERVTGQTYEDFLQKEIFKRLGMTATGYDSHQRIIRNRASGYGGLVKSNAAYIDMSVPFAAGALVSTTEDLLRFDQALYGEKLLKNASLDEMFRPAADQRGYGWTIHMRQGKQSIEKDGSIPGFSAVLMRYPTERVTVIVLGNNRSASAVGVGDALSAIVFGMPYTMPSEKVAEAVPVETLRRYAGQYQPPAGSLISITLEDGKLFRQIGQGPKIELLAVSEREFFMQGNELVITFVSDEDGKVTGQKMIRGGRETVAVKVN